MAMSKTREVVVASVANNGESTPHKLRQTNDDSLWSIKRNGLISSGRCEPKTHILIENDFTYIDEDNEDCRDLAENIKSQDNNECNALGNKRAGSTKPSSTHCEYLTNNEHKDSIRNTTNNNNNNNNNDEGKFNDSSIDISEKQWRQDHHRNVNSNANATATITNSQMINNYSDGVITKHIYNDRNRNVQTPPAQTQRPGSNATNNNNKIQTNDRNCMQFESCVDDDNICHDHHQRSSEINATTTTTTTVGNSSPRHKEEMAMPKECGPITQRITISSDSIGNCCRAAHHCQHQLHRVQNQTNSISNEIPSNSSDCTTEECNNDDHHHAELETSAINRTLEQHSPLQNIRLAESGNKFGLTTTGTGLEQDTMEILTNCKSGNSSAITCSDDAGQKTSSGVSSSRTDTDRNDCNKMNSNDRTKFRDDDEDDEISSADKFNDKKLLLLNRKSDKSDTNGTGKNIEKCDFNKILLLAAGDDEDDDPYIELQEYLERVKNEINEVFEQYKAANRNDELPRCTEPDSDTSNNKLPLHEMSCILNGTKSDMKMNEISSRQKDQQNGNDDDDAGDQDRGHDDNDDVDKHHHQPHQGDQSFNGRSSLIKATNKVVTIVETSQEAASTAAEFASSQKPRMASMTSMFSSPTRSEDQKENVDQPSSQAQAATPHSHHHHVTASSSSSATPEYQPQHPQNHKQPQKIDKSSYDKANYSSASSLAHDSADDVNIWANKFLRELDNLMGSDKQSSVRFEKNHVVTSASSSSGTAERTSTGNILKPEKHTTIPLQSFNLDCSLMLDSPKSPHRTVIIKSSLPSSANCDNSMSSTNNKTTSSSSAVDNNLRSHHHLAANALETTLVPTTTTAVLKIEENDGNEKSSTITAQSMIKSNRLQHGGGDAASKKGSTSTIWTSEESILRSVGAVDEDNKSSSSSACEDASGGVLSSGKSGISLDSSGIENDNVESGIGTATPPKDLADVGLDMRWPSEDPPINLEFLRKFKLQKSNSVVSADDPDLLEILSLCEEANRIDDEDVDDDDVGPHDRHDEFDLNTFDEFDCVDSGEYSVVLRKKSHLLQTQTDEDSTDGNEVVFNRSHKCRSHSLGTASPHQSHHHPHHQFKFDVNENIKSKEYKNKATLCLALRQEPFQSIMSSNFHDLPSPSSASLHSGHDSLSMQELTTKSNSAPLLLKKERKRDDFGGPKQTLRYSRSQSDRYLAEIEAVEACKWLRAAGFPQYAQMYEDNQFPIDLTNVGKDHPNLENDPMQSLYRRLCILNRCATMRLRIDSTHKSQIQRKDESDDENFALSENWTFQPDIRRWSRIAESGLELCGKNDSSSKESSPERFEEEIYATADVEQTMLSLEMSQNAPVEVSVRLRRTGSERLKNGAKAILRRVESIKSRRRKRQNREGIVISGPQILDLPADYQNELNVSAASPRSDESGFNFDNSNSNRPQHFHTMPHLKEGRSDDSSLYCSDSQESYVADKSIVRRQSSKSRKFAQRASKTEDVGVHSDSECQIKDTQEANIKSNSLTRGGSFTLGVNSKKAKEELKTRSLRSRASFRKVYKTSESDSESTKIRRSPVVRWHSFQENDRPDVCLRKPPAEKSIPDANQGTPFSAMSCGQLQIMRKLALVTLTGQMERYCPNHRSGWNWELPKFIKKIKMPDYKDKRVFGVPLVLMVQRTGHAVPTGIRAAFNWLRENALDQIGLFRKSGVKSRIAKLKERVENCDSAAECMSVFDTQQAYDVADMLKQYFRDLPEALLTTKMSETFVAIFQHLPPDVRADAVQCAVLLLPDENREVLYALLYFLTLVANESQYNQMTANNLAVCFAPSLFHNSNASGTSPVSTTPRRRKTTGVPDAKELSEAKASHECLAFMITNFAQIYTASADKISKCKFGYMEDSKPVPLEALGKGMHQNWRGYLYECTRATIKEGREKSRGWIANSSLDPNVEIAYKKVGDGHPLRLWRCITEVEAPPNEVVDHILNQRASWDVNLLQCKIVKKLDERSEIFQYALDGQTSSDFCVLRSWQLDLPRNACVIVETSVVHPKAKPMLQSVRGVVLASRYLIEPSGSGRSRLMHLARVDIKGKTPEWYNKNYGHICSHYLSKIRSNFRHVADGPESKV